MPMDDDLKQRLDEIERKLDSTRELVRLGLPVITGLDTKVSALVNSHVRLSDSLRQLADSQGKTEESLARLSEAQAKTEDALQRLITTLTHHNGDQH